MAIDRTALLRKRFETGLDENVAFTYLVVVTLTWWLWSDSSHSRLLIWAGALGLAAPLPKLLALAAPSFRLWYPLRVAAESILGVAWGLLALTAMPAEPLNQALLAAALIGVTVASGAGPSQFFGPFLAFMIPFGVMNVLGYLSAGPSMRITALFVGIASVYSIALAAAHRTTHLGVVDLISVNEQLVHTLGDERTALLDANAGLDRQAWVDALTGLSNRAAMSRHLAERFGGSDDGVGDDSGAAPSAVDLKVTVAYLDLDGFKQINDTRGHRIGDLVLIAVAKRLVARVSDLGIVCRLGGDEITVLCDGVDPEHLGELLAEAFDDPFHIEGRSMPIGAGIGVATTSVPCSSEELIRFADRALYRHKARADRSVRYCVFDKDMLEEMREHEATEAELALAFDSGDVNAWLQPIVEVGTGRIVAAEALARWEHPSGIRSAGSFIPHLAERRLLGQLADRMIAQVSAANTALASRGFDDFRIAVNIPPTEIERVLQRPGNEAALANLTIEITEEAIATDVGSVVEVLTEARRAGAQVVLDDIGTGFSSLSLATLLPLDGLKIDGSFVENMADPRSRAVISAIVDLGRNLGLEVIAEGVESSYQADELAELGVGRAQGYLYDAAMPVTQLIEVVASQEPAEPLIQSDR